MIGFVVGSRSDVGRARPGNEDALFVGERLFAVADGMGGHAGGEIAAEIVVERCAAGVAEWTIDALVELVQEANRRIVEKADEDTALRGMGTTITLLASLDHSDEYPDERIGIANVGDSRTYVFDGEVLELLTDDHTLVQRLVRSGALTPEQAEEHPQRNVLTRALGIAEDVLVDSWELRVFVGDRFLLCSDGLTGELDDEQIASVLRRLADPQEAVDELVRLANESGGHDNITIVLVDVIAGDDRPADSTGEHERVVAQVAGEERPGATPEPELPDGLVLAADAMPGAGEEVAVDPIPGGVHAEESDRDDGKQEVAADSPASEADDAPTQRLRRLTWRVGVFVVAVLLVTVLAAGAVGWSARNTFYVGFHQDSVVIYRGQPGGVLWFAETVEVRTDIDRDRVPEQYRQELDDGKTYASLNSAETFVANLLTEIERLELPEMSVSTPPVPPLRTP